MTTQFAAISVDMKRVKARKDEISG